MHKPGSWRIIIGMFPSNQITVKCKMLFAFLYIFFTFASNQQKNEIYILKTPQDGPSSERSIAKP